MSASLKQLIAANPEAAPRGSVLPCETFEAYELDPQVVGNQHESGARQRGRRYLLERAENFSTYHGSKMELFWGSSSNTLTLRAVHTKK